jgi:hypothetical protein
MRQDHITHRAKQNKVLAEIPTSAAIIEKTADRSFNSITTQGAIP